MSRHITRFGVALASLAASGILASTALAADADFYRGKKVTISIGSGVGGGFDAYSRTVGQFLGRHIPGNPTVQPNNRTGAGGRVNANWLYTVAPQDGTVLGNTGPWLAMEPMWQTKGVKFDPVKFHWLISVNREVSSCLVANKQGMMTLGDLKKNKIAMGSSGPFTPMTSDVRALNAIVGTKIKMVHGFKGTRNVMFAVEKGELDGSCGIWISSLKAQYINYVKSGQVNVMIQMGLTSHPEYPNVPNIIDMVKSKDDRQALGLVFGQLEMGRPFVAPPGTPLARVTLLRKAFADTVKDPDFLAAAKKRRLEVRPLSGEKVQALVTDFYTTPPHIVKRVRTMLGR